MRRGILVLLAASTVLAAAATAQEAIPTAPFVTTVDSAAATAGAREYYVLDFYTDW